MAFDPALAARIRDLLVDASNLVEMKMFGGVGFVLSGNMAVGASTTGGLMVRVDPERGSMLVETTQAEPMEMRGRQMTGWLLIDAEHLTTDDNLSTWVDIGVEFAASLPPK